MSLDSEYSTRINERWSQRFLELLLGVLGASLFGILALTHFGYANSFSGDFGVCFLLFSCVASIVAVRKFKNILLAVIIIIVASKVEDLSNVILMHNTEYALRGYFSIIWSIAGLIILPVRWGFPLMTLNMALFIFPRMYVFHDFPVFFKWSISYSFSAISSLAICLTLRRQYELRDREVFDSHERLRKLNHAVIHDLNNQLSIVYGRFQNMTKTPENNTDPTKLQKFKSSMEQLISFNKSLTDLIRGHAIDKNFKQFKISELMVSLRESIEVELQKKNLNLDIEFSKEATLLSDLELLKYSILGNLLINCIQHLNQNGVIKLAYSVNPQEDQVDFDIFDNGPGMPPEWIKALQGGPTPEQSSGTGRGLGIVKYFCIQLGGDFKVIKSDASGSHFRVTLKT